MENDSPVMTDTAVKSMATGLCMMAFFTTLWAGIAYSGLKGTPYAFALVGFLVFAVTFVTIAISLFKIANHFPKLTSAADIAEENKMGKWFGIIFGAEGLGIFIGINVVINLGHPELVIPVIALIVGLHFYPLAKVFKRRFDYYLATWSTVVAILGIIFSLNKTLSEHQVMAFLGIGIAIATSCYGFYMVVSARHIMSAPRMEI